MSKLDLPKLYATQISQSEWFHAIGHEESDAFRLEDNTKRQRLQRLNDLIGLPFDRAVEFAATDIAGRTPKFRRYLDEHAAEYCALRLVPGNHKLPKLRMRGVTLKGAVEWFDEQQISPADYRADILPHSNNQIWSTVFVVNNSGAYGEIVAGSHTQLTQGFYESQPPFRFSWDFHNLSLEPDSEDAKEHLSTILEWLTIKDSKIRATLQTEFDAKFEQNCLEGYFETTASPEFGLWFVDYNRILGRLYENFRAQKPTSDAALVKGQAGSTGVASGRVRIVTDLADSQFQAGEILVCPMTTPEFVPLMRQAAAIVTDFGGLLSHAAIVARELRKPCLTATGNATAVLHTGQSVTVDANLGIVREAS